LVFYFVRARHAVPLRWGGGWWWLAVRAKKVKKMSGGSMRGVVK